MTGACSSLDPDSWVLGLISAADCQAGQIGSGGWQGLAGSAMFNTVLTGLLTLAVARLGYRLMARQVVPSDIALLLVHMGVVIALTTSWQAYDRLIYRVAMNGPAEVASVLFPAAGVDASNLSGRLQNAYDTLVDQPEGEDEPPAANPAAPRDGQATVTEAMPIAESLAMTDRRQAADVMVISGAGSWVAVRLSIALLLALGPFALVASLFPFSVGLFVGWLRAVVAAALASLAVPLAISIELETLEGPVRAALSENDPHVAGLNAIVWTFVLVILALLYAVQKFAGGLCVPASALAVLRDERSSAQPETASPILSDISSHESHTSGRSTPAEIIIASRTQGIVRAIEARSRSATGMTQIGGSRTEMLPVNSIPRTRIIRRGSQIVDGARRTADERGQVNSQRPEAQS